MSILTCTNCGKKQRWYEQIKKHPITKKPICRKCNTPFDSIEIIPDKVDEKESNTPKKSPVEKLVLDIFQSFNRLRKNQNDLLIPSIPLPYLGDFDKYNSSRIKVLTVGLNPSQREFPKEMPYSRFNQSEKIFKTGSLDNNEVELYLDSLKTYFQNTPEKRYNAFEPILTGLKTSYNIKAENQALHTFFCSPYATTYSWSKLRSSSQFTLSREGREYWHRLVKILEPDIILFSVDEKYLKRVQFKRSGWKVFKSIKLKTDGTPRAKPYTIKVTQSRIKLKKLYLVNGLPSYLPFGSISKQDKEQLGIDLYSLVSSN